MSDYSNSITAIATVAAAITSIAAAFAALKAANAADKSAAIAEASLKLDAHRGLMSVASEIVAERNRIDSIMIALKVEFVNARRRCGSYDNSGLNMGEQALEADRTKAATLATDAEALIASPAMTLDASCTDMDIRRTQFQQQLTEIRTIRESMSRELDNRRSQKS